MPGQAMRVVRLMGIKACALKKPLGAGTLPRNRQSYLIDRRQSSRAGDWHLATTQGMLAALRASGL